LSRDELHDEIERQKKDYEDLRAKDHKRFEVLLSERQEIELRLTKRESTISELHIKIKTLETTRNELEGLIDSLNEKLETLKDVKAQLSGA